MIGAGRHALITGISGQDGSFLAELLLERGYAVTGLTRRVAGQPLGASEHLRGRIELIEGDLERPAELSEAVRGLRPDELYHLAAPSFVPDSWRDPAATIRQITVATAALLRAIRESSPGTRAFFAGSSQMFGEAGESPQHEDTTCRPQSPYATAKLSAHQLVGQIRRRDGIFACSGILFNHESERRPESFVTRRVTKGAAAIKLGLLDELTLGDLDAVRDWSFAGDVVRGAWLMLQQTQPCDYVLASGTPHSVRDLVRVAFAAAGVDPDGHVRVGEGLVRPPEETIPVGDPGRARRELGWEPTMSFEQLVERMVRADLSRLSAAV